MKNYIFLDEVENDKFPYLWVNGHDFYWNGYFWEFVK